jgi:hypothetical protein
MATEGRSPLDVGNKDSQVSELIMADDKEVNEIARKVFFKYKKAFKELAK